MAHLRSYKSFNLDEIEEIESRIFCSGIVAPDNSLKGCPGSTNIPNIIYESSLGALYKREFGEEKHINSWEIIKNNIISVLHHAKHADSLVVHLNERYIENDDLDFYDDISVCEILDSHELKELSWSKNEPKVQSNIPLEEDKTLPQDITENLCSRFLAMCLCRSRKNN